MSDDNYGLSPGVEDLLRNPTVEKALPFYNSFRKAHGALYPKDATCEVTALAMVHKARLVWQGSTAAMVMESQDWLIAHGMSPHLNVLNGRLQ